MIRSLLKKLVGVFWLIPGFLLWAAYPPMGEWSDSLFALAPLLWFSRTADPRSSARRWFMNGFVFWFSTLLWMPAIVKNGGPWPLVVLGWGALAAYSALFFGVFGWLVARYWRWAGDRGATGHFLGILVAEPLLWCGLELVRSRLFGGFAWNHLGLPLVVHGFGSPAAIGGVYLVSAVVLLVNGTIASIAERILARDGRWFRSLDTFVPFALVFALYQFDGRREPAEDAVRPLGVAMVQRNFPCCFKGPAADPYLAYSNLLGRVESLRPDLVVLPESALCEFGDVNSPRAVDFAETVARRLGPVLAGGTRYGDGETFNSAALYDGRRIQVYDKVHLVPFGEFIPGDKFFPALQRLAPVGSCTPGAGGLVTFGDVPFGVAICFEDTDSALMRRHAAAGARFLCFITNDSWFSDSDEALAHAWQAVARAIETGLPVVRTGNSGVTGTIRPDGTACWLANAEGSPLLDAEGTMFDRIEVSSPPPRPTAYTLVGDLPLALAFALFILAMIVVKYKPNYEQRRTLSL